MFVLFSFLGKCQSRRHNFGCEKSSTTKCSICYMDGETQLRDKHQKLIQYKYTQKSCTRFLYIFIFFSHSKYLSNIPVKFQISTSFRFFFQRNKNKKGVFLSLKEPLYPFAWKENDNFVDNDNILSFFTKEAYFIR